MPVDRHIPPKSDLSIGSGIIIPDAATFFHMKIAYGRPMCYLCRSLSEEQSVQFLPIGYVAFLVDIGDMAVYGIDANVQPLRYQCRGEPVQEKLCNFRLALSKEMLLLESLQRRRYILRTYQQVYMVILYERMNFLYKFNLMI